ncbi:hypothetical protein Taro_004943 [Colocasia esculenta]|uniref:Uncharacterized protein n=1 Tax=Colocasia esculenta TaxID=4460 RepID=A0A843TWD7_COLES|nr:hypothetical protein [Colocasia esculenta]
MAASRSSGSVGGYSAAFLTTDQLERFSAVKIKLCGNKAVDLEDLEKHGMHSVVEALQRLKWTGICTVSEPSYLHLVKAFYICLKTEEDGSLTSMVKGVIPPLVSAPTIIEESVIGGAAHTEGEHEDIQIEETPSIPVVETAMEENHEDMIPEVVAPCHIEYVHMEVAPAQREPEAQGEQDVQGEPIASAPADQFQKGLVRDTSDEDDEPVVGSRAKGKGVATGIPLLTRKAHHSSRKKKIHVHLEPVIARLNAQGEILCSFQSDVTSIFLSQSTEAKDIGAIKSELQGMRSELGILKKLVTVLSDFVRVHLTAQAPPVPTQSVS